jgi:hypothetical protein
VYRAPGQGQVGEEEGGGEEREGEGEDALMVDDFDSIDDEYRRLLKGQRSDSEKPLILIQRLSRLLDEMIGIMADGRARKRWFSQHRGQRMRLEQDVLISLDDYKKACFDVSAMLSQILMHRATDFLARVEKLKKEKARREATRSKKPKRDKS